MIQPVGKPPEVSSAFLYFDSSLGVFRVSRYFPLAIIIYVAGLMAGQLAGRFIVSQPLFYRTKRLINKTPY